MHPTIFPFFFPFLQWFSYLHFSPENSHMNVCRKPRQRIFVSDKRSRKIMLCFLLPHITYQKERKCHKKKITKCGLQRPISMLAHFGGSIAKTRALIIFVYICLLLSKQSFHRCFQWQVGSNNEHLIAADWIYINCHTQSQKMRQFPVTVYEWKCFKKIRIISMKNLWF